MIGTNIRSRPNRRARPESEAGQTTTNGATISDAVDDQNGQLDTAAGDVLPSRASTRVEHDDLAAADDDSTIESVAILAAEAAADDAEATAAVAEAEAAVARARAAAKRARARADQARASAGTRTAPPVTRPEPAAAPAAALAPAPAAAPATAPTAVAVVAEPEDDTAAAVRLDKAPDQDTDRPVELAEPARRRISRLMLVAIVVVVLAAAFAVVAGAALLGTKKSSAATLAKSRDTVLLAARQDIQVLNTLDYHSVDAGLANWLAASTGTLHDQLSNVTAAAKQTLVASKPVTTAKVLDAAVTQVDPQAGSATVIASIQLTVTPDGGKAVVKRDRLSATMTRVDGTWKVASLVSVGVTLK